MSNFEKKLLQSAKEALAFAKGEMEPPRVYVPPTIDVAAIRKKLGLSQARFAARFGLSATTVRDWEQKRRNPDQIARTLLTIIDRNHEALEQALMGSLLASLKQVFATRPAGLDRKLRIVGDVRNAIEIGDLRKEKIAHEEIVRQPHAAEVFKGFDGTRRAHLVAIA